MISFRDFEVAAPAIATPLRARLAAAGIGLLGTVRRDGSPRISPIEISFQRDGIFVGMMPGSRKALDLARDPRYTLNTPVADRLDVAGEGKLFGTAVAITDPADVGAILAKALEGMGEDGQEISIDDFAGSPVFELRITGAAWQAIDGDAWTTASWTADDPSSVGRRRREGPTGTPVDVERS